MRIHITLIDQKGFEWQEWVETEHIRGTIRRSFVCQQAHRIGDMTFALQGRIKGSYVYREVEGEPHGQQAQRA